jgi:hypothetical protein
MENSPSASELLWEEQQLAGRERTKLERREWLKHFVLVFGLIVATVAVAMVLAGLGAGRPASL